MYERRGEGERILVVCSFSKTALRCRLPEGYAPEGAELLLGNYPEPTPGVLRPYEAQVWRWKD